MAQPRIAAGPLRRWVALAVAAAAGAAALGAPACTHNAPARRLVAATVFPVFDLTRRVADDRLDVRLILLSFWITFRGTWETRGRKF